MIKRSCRAKTDEIKFSTSLLGQEGTEPNLFEHEEIQHFLLPELRIQFILILYVWPKFRNKIKLLKSKTNPLDLCKWMAGLHILQSTQIYLRHSQLTGKPAKLDKFTQFLTFPDPGRISVSSSFSYHPEMTQGLPPTNNHLKKKGAKIHMLKCPSWPISHLTVQIGTE